MSHRLSWWEKTASSFGVLAFFTFLFLLPRPAVAAQCHGKIGEPPLGKMYAIFYLTSNEAADGNGEPVGGGKECYVLVNTSQTTASFNDLVQEEVFSADWGNFNIDKSYFRDGEYFNPQDEFSIPLKNAQLQLQKNYITNDGTRDMRLRYIFGVGGNAYYLYFMRLDFASTEVREKQVECRNKMIAQDARCNPPELPKIDSLGEGIAAFDAYISDVNKYPVECKTFYDTCIQDQLKAMGGYSATSTSKFDQYLNDPKYKPPQGYSGPLPACAFSFQGCRNVNDLLQLLINIGKIAFSLIGTAAFLMFIYGGFTIILSTGNAEQVKKGKSILLAAVTGMIIAFGAYVLIDFILNALQVGTDFRAIK